MARKKKYRPTPGPNAARNRKRRTASFKRAHLSYRLLLHTLGGTCAICGQTDPTLLSIDHIDGITYDRLKLRLDARIYRYIEEYLSGVRLRVLCLICNGKFKPPPGEPTLPDEEAPPIDPSTLPEAPF